MWEALTWMHWPLKWMPRIKVLVNVCLTYVYNGVTDGGLSQLQKKPTRQGKVLDLLCISNPSLLKPINTIREISNHDEIVVADFYLQAFVNKRPPHNIPLWSRANWNAMKLSTSQFAEDFNQQLMSGILIRTGRALKTTWKVWCTIMCPPTSFTMDEHHITPNVQEKNRLYTKTKKTGSNYEKFVEYQKATQTELNKAHWRYVNGVLV